MILRWFNSVPFSQRLTILVVLIGLTGAGFYFLVWQPWTDEISMLKKNIESIQKEIDAEVRRKGNVSDVIVSMKDNETLDYPHEALAISAVQPQQYRQEVINVVNRYGLHLSLWNPGREPSPGTNENRLPIQGRFEGGYHQIAQGFAALLQLPWVLEINAVRLRLSPHIDYERSSLVADFHLVSFSVSPSVELPSSLNN